MIDDIITNKTAVIERCLKRIDEEHKGDASRLDKLPY